MTSDRERSLLLQSEISFDSLYGVISRRWWWLAAAILAGGLLGLLLSFALPPGYQATASLGIGIDYGRTHPLNREAERQALLQVQELLLSDQVMEATLQDIDPAVRERHGLSGSPGLRVAVRLDRFENRWDLSVFLSDSEDAASLANAWSEASAGAIEQALEAAWRARALQLQVYELGCQLELTEDQQAAVLRCQQGAPEEAAELQQELVAATQQSHGLLPALTFAQLRLASPPENPVYRARSWLILGGLLIGLAVGVAALLAMPLKQSYSSDGNTSRRSSPQRGQDETRG